MARANHVEIVKQGASAISKWCEHHPCEALDLHGAKLSGADLTGADLSGADLSGSHLFEANLSGANLNEANLAGAHLSRVNLSGSHLSGSHLSDAFTEQTVFALVDLSKVRGLDSVNHRGPSAIGVETLYTGKIPEVFLRGCGVPENLITCLPSLTDNAIEFYNCFISYSHSDKSFARRLHDTLQRRGIRCWLDEQDDKHLHFGGRVYRLWDKVLLCVSCHSLNSHWISVELNSAIETKITTHKDQVLATLNLDGSLLERSGDVAAMLRNLRAADFTNWESDNAKFEAAFEKVVNALKIDVQSATARTARATARVWRF